MSISATSGTIDTQPAWTTTVNTGAIPDGAHYRASVWARGTDATGQSQIAIAWFDAANDFLTNSVSTSLPTGDSRWTELSVDATAPAGAAYAVLSLQSFHNSGTTWFDDAGFDH